MKELNLLLEQLTDVVKELETFSVNNNDFCIDEIVEIKEKVGSIKDTTWRLA
jgi:hypothetical protein